MSESHETSALAGSVCFALAPGVSIRLQAIKGPPDQLPIRVKVKGNPALSTALKDAIYLGAMLERFRLPQQTQGPRHVRLEVTCEGDIGAAAAHLPVQDLLAWAASAGALAYQLFYAEPSSWRAHTLMLAQLDLGAAPEHPGVLLPLGETCQDLAIGALADGNRPYFWADAAVVLAGGAGNTNAQMVLAQAVAQHLPKAKVRYLASTTDLVGTSQQAHQPGVGEAWFPRVGANQACVLEPIRVNVRPWSQVDSEDAPIDVLGIEPTKGICDRLRGKLKAWRRQEAPSATQYHTLVTVPKSMTDVSGDSYDLALLVADRVARGREWPGRGRILATGEVSTDVGARGAVMDVDFKAEKCTVFGQEAGAGDTVLVPDNAAWRTQASVVFTQEDVSTRTSQTTVRVVYVRHAIAGAAQSSAV